MEKIKSPEGWVTPMLPPGVTNLFELESMMRGIKGIEILQLPWIES